MTHEPDFYKELYQTKFRGDDTKTYQIFGVPIGNVETKKITVPPSSTSDKISPKVIY